MSRSSDADEPERRESAQDASYRWLKQRIASLPRDVGTLITESEVSQAAKTGRTPAREALLRMEAEGFLQIVSRKGAFVPPVSDAEIVAVMQARELVEDWCARRVAQTQPGLAQRLERIIADQRRLIGEPAEFIHRDRQFHRAIVRSAGNPVIADFYEMLRERLIRMGLLAIAAVEDRARTVLDEHEAIAAALSSGDADAAAAAVRNHLASTLAALQLPVHVLWQDDDLEADPALGVPVPGLQPVPSRDPERGAVPGREDAGPDGEGA